MTRQTWLEGVRVVNLAVNLPGPGAAARLHAMGAIVVKVEPPGGDQMERLSRAWYDQMRAGQEVLRLDVKSKSGRDRLGELLATADLLLTSVRPSSLSRMGLDWPSLHQAYPRLCQVAIVGHPAPDQELAGHDLTYAASLGLAVPPGLPRTLVADLIGLEQTVGAALALLIARDRGAGAGYVEIALSDAAALAAQPLAFGLTAPEGILGGALPHYNLYQSSDGWLALAALETHFWQRLTADLRLPQEGTTVGQLRAIFLTRTSADWIAWARERDVPLVAVRQS